MDKELKSTMKGKESTTTDTNNNNNNPMETESPFHAGVDEGKTAVVDKTSDIEAGLKQHHKGHHHHRKTNSRRSHSYDSPNDNSPIGRLMLGWEGLKHSVARFYENHFRAPGCCQPVYDALEDYFDCTSAGSTVETELFAGVINFFSCMYILAVVSEQMGKAGYDTQISAAVISFVTGIATICSGMLTNTPLVVAPATAVSIYFVTNLQQYNLSNHSGNLIVMYGGIVLVFLGLIGPLSRLISKVIPSYIQLATTIGIGLITALSGYTEIEMVVQGRYTLLAVGPITPQICIAMSGLVLIAIGVYYHSRFAYLIGMLWGTFLWWSSQNAWPKEIAALPQFQGDFFDLFEDNDGILVTFEMIFLSILTLFGLAKALCELAHITTKSTTTTASGVQTVEEEIPMGRLLLIIIGVANIGSGCLSGPPIILSPECASGIKAGARTGLSAVVCGILFLLSIFLAPLFTSIPAAATSPVLIMIGMILFQNVKYIDFSTKYGIAAFVCLTLIPFTDSIIGGLGFGYATYTIISVLNGDVKENAEKFWDYYFGEDEQEGLIEGFDEEGGLSLANYVGYVKEKTSTPDTSIDERMSGSGSSSGNNNEGGISPEESKSGMTNNTNPGSKRPVSMHSLSTMTAPSELGPGPRPQEESSSTRSIHSSTRTRRNSFSTAAGRVRKNTATFLSESLKDPNLGNDIVPIDYARF
jgi:AGZA family xanthine/uracil permease-like MFS transporter